MVIDVLAQADRYASLHPSFAQAFAFLRSAGLLALPAGRHAIDGDRIYVSIDDVSGRMREEARLEYHRAHIDIQLTLSGDEQIGWMPLSACRVPEGAFDPARDVGFYRDRPATWLTLPPDTFAIFFPEDAHAPLAGSGAVRKAIVKVAC